MEPTEFICNYSGCNCGKPYSSQKALAGHLGGGTSLLPQAIPHGTRRGYEKEVRLGIDTCNRCRAANAKYTRESRARGRLAARKGTAQ